MPLPYISTIITNRANLAMVLWFRRTKVTPLAVGPCRPYIKGSMPKTGWPFSVSQFSSSSQSEVMVSSAM